MRKIEDRTKKMILKIAVVVFCIALIFGGIMIYGRYQMSKIPKLSFQEILEYTTKDNADAVITVGIVKDGQISYKVYGENGKELPAELHTYKIGSLTKTFTAALITGKETASFSCISVWKTECFNGRVMRPKHEN